MYGGDCNAAITKAFTAVTRVQSHSQKVGSGDEGLGLLCLDLSAAETDFWWLEDDEQYRDFAHFPVSCDTLLRSPWTRSSLCVPTTVLVLKQPSQSIHTSTEA